MQSGSVEPGAYDKISPSDITGLRFGDAGSRDLRTGGDAGGTKGDTASQQVFEVVAIN